MEEQCDTPQIDELLLPFLHAATPQESERQLEFLLYTHAHSLIEKITRRRMQSSASDIEDVSSEVLVQLIARLRDCKADPKVNSIADFRGYVATVAFNACHEQLRQKYPRRHRLKNRLRYLMNHHQSFALWEIDDRQLYCGLREWIGKKSARSNQRLIELREDPKTFDLSYLANKDLQRMNLADLLILVFKSIAGPAELDVLVGVVADWTGVKDEVAQDYVEATNSASFPQTHASLDEELDLRSYVQRLWTEVCQLPQRQCIALLLNMKDARGDNCTELLSATGVASVRQIAHALDIPEDEFGAMWNDLPLDDATIAGRLSITRQQVINLRKCARERLARRMKGF